MSEGNDSDQLANGRDALIEVARLAMLTSETLVDGIEKVGAIVADSLSEGGKILACGNGGSAADAQHFVAEFIGHLADERRSLPAITLSVDPSIVTAVSNDYGYENLFARQVEGLGNQGDVLFGMSTSGSSRNVLNAFRVARGKQLRTIALVGETSDTEIEACDVVLRVPSNTTQRIQEIHMVLLHEICSAAERRLLL